ncbi:hypothetical protein OS493_039573 [Desmophyllum pertusum]|uniref:Uncharacterized protein n=1 Tax=Desmophyllum pertusum TaxID=174260 RepID=A0A9X0D775_9CNID|nr:hypothetical protein OS493_039573 [Desmophyllum pertusum]
MSFRFHKHKLAGQNGAIVAEGEIREIGEPDYERAVNSDDDSTNSADDSINSEDDSSDAEESCATGTVAMPRKRAHSKMRKTSSVKKRKGN